MQSVARTYFQTQVSTVGQGEVLIMLYNGALKFLAQAKEGIVAKDYAAKGIAISKAIDIINELSSTLNKEEGGELASNLHNLYFLCSTRLLQANVKMDIKMVDSVIDILSGIKNAFEQIINKPEAQAASARIAAKQGQGGGAHVPIKEIKPAPGLGLGRSHASVAYSNAAVASSPVTGTAQTSAPLTVKTG
jgi:flagellar protein FliS